MSSFPIILYALYWLIFFCRYWTPHYFVSLFSPIKAAFFLVCYVLLALHSRLCIPLLKHCVWPPMPCLFFFILYNKMAHCFFLKVESDLNLSCFCRYLQWSVYSSALRLWRKWSQYVGRCVSGRQINMADSCSSVFGSYKHICWITNMTDSGFSTVISSAGL